MCRNTFTAISFYIVAHADDWQLFMCPNICNDLSTADRKIVFIITTAGDAGKDEKYWTAREEGSKSSLRFYLSSLGSFAESTGYEKYNGHSIYYFAIGDALFYFLRLPDGNLDGSGFQSSNFQSLLKFESGEIHSITTVDKSITYNSLENFHTTLETIITRQSEGIAERWINYINPDKARNPDDHADHIATGKAIQNLPDITEFKQALFVGYNSANISKELNGTDLFWKAGMFAAYDRTVRDKSGYNTLLEGAQTYIRWCLHTASYITVVSDTIKI